MTKGIKSRLRDSILKRRGMETDRYTGLKKVASIPPPDGIKTLAMRQIEARFDTPIEELLMEGELSEVAYKLGVHFTTVSKWRERLGLR